MQYHWTNFNLKDALAGILVGIPQGDGGTSDGDLSVTGKLVSSNKTELYKVTIKGYELWVDENGNVTKSIPSSNFFEGETLQMVTTDMGTDNAVGPSATRSSTYDAQHSLNATIDKMEPRDYFAVDVLNAMIAKIDHPEAVDDTTMLMYSRSAYKWAQAMMTAAADSREGDYSTPPQTVEVDTSQLQSNTEKILYNISKSLESFVEDGLPVQGVEGGEPITITGEVEVTNEDPIDVAVTSMPSSE